MSYEAMQQFAVVALGLCALALLVFAIIEVLAARQRRKEDAEDEVLRDTIRRYIDRDTEPSSRGSSPKS